MDTKDAGRPRQPQTSSQDLVLLMVSLKRRMEQMASQTDRHLQSLRGSVGEVDRKVTNTLDTAGSRMTALADRALQTAAGEFDEAASRANDKLHHAADRYALAQDELVSATRRRMWVANITLLACAVVVIGGGAYQWHALDKERAEVTRLRSEVDYLSRVNRADWIPCSKDRLCARIEDKGARYGGNQEYRVIALRRVATE